MNSELFANIVIGASLLVLTVVLAAFVVELWKEWR